MSSHSSISVRASAAHSHSSSSASSPPAALRPAAHSQASPSSRASSSAASVLCFALPLLQRLPGGARLAAVARGCVEQEQLRDTQREIARLLPSALTDNAVTRQWRSSARRRRDGCGTQAHHRQWLNVDACGLVSATAVWTIMIYCVLCVDSYVISPWLGVLTSFSGFANFVLFNGCAVLAMVCHARTMLSNPGAVPPDARPTTPEGWARECHKCKNFKPARAHHCSICNRCVIVRTVATPTPRVRPLRRAHS